MSLGKLEIRLGGYKHYRHLALLMIIIFISFAAILTLVRFTLVNEIENFAITMDLMKEEGIINWSFPIMQGGAPQLMGLAIFLSILIFGILDGIFSLMLWSTKPPLRRENIVIPLYVTYICARLFLLYFIIQVLIWALTNQNPATGINLLYMIIILIIIGDLGIIIAVHKLVLSKKWMIKGPGLS